MEKRIFHRDRKKAATTTTPVAYVTCSTETIFHTPQSKTSINFCTCTTLAKKAEFANNYRRKQNLYFLNKNSHVERTNERVFLHTEFVWGAADVDDIHKFYFLQIFQSNFSAILFFLLIKNILVNLGALSEMLLDFIWERKVFVYAIVVRLNQRKKYMEKPCEAIE